MKNRNTTPSSAPPPYSAAYSKAHQSDGEDDDIVDASNDENKKKQVAKISQEEVERRQLENAPVIADSEISPAAYLFQNHDEQDDLNLFESQ